MRTIIAKLATMPLVLVIAAAALAQEEPVSIGVRIKVHSQVLNEDRTVLVSLPEAYDRGRLRCPVIYVLDGSSLFLPTVAASRFMGDQGLAPQMIVVGVPSGTTRTRDLTPSSAIPDKEYPDAGGADPFRRFLTEELRPTIEGRYRTEPFRALIGWSFGGLFAVHAMLSDPASFDAYIAISPSVWWDKEAEIEKARKLFASGAPLRKFLYISHGRENNGIPASVETFTTVLGRTAPAGLRWKMDYLAGDNHGSTPARAIYNGLESLFAAYAIPEDGIPTASDLEKRYAALTEEFGFPCRLAEQQADPRLETFRKHLEAVRAKLGK